MAEELAKIATQVAEKVTSESTRGPVPQTQSNFAEMLSAQMADQQQASQQVLQLFGLAPENRNPIQAIPADGIRVDPAQVSAAQEIRSHSQVMNLLGDVNRGALQMDSIMELSTSGRHFSPTELLAMQAGIYSIVQEIELTSKVFEGINTAQKQLVNTNVA